MAGQTRALDVGDELSVKSLFTTWRIIPGMQTTQSPAANVQPIGWVDVMRFVAVFIVVMAHINGWSESPLWARTFYYSFSRIGVPVFFMISGYLLLSKQEAISVFLKKRIVRVAIPFVFWSIIYDLINSQPFAQSGVTVEAVLKIFIRIIRGPREGHLWFMYFLIGLYLFTPILRVFVHKAQRTELFYFIGLWFLVVPILNIIEALTPIKNGFEVYNMGGYVGFFLLGYYLGGEESPPQGLRAGLTLLTFGFLFTFCILFFDIPPIDNELPFRSYQSFNIILMSAGAFITLRSMAEKAPPRLIALARHGGKASFGIYLVHLLVLRGLSLLWVALGFDPQAGNAVIIIPLVATAAFFLSWAVVYLIQRIPVLRSTV